MIKKTFFILICSLVFVGCAERGALVPLKLTEKHIKKHNSSKNQNIPTLVLKSSREDEMQKNISGSLILIIGLLLIL